MKIFIHENTRNLYPFMTSNICLKFFHSYGFGWTILLRRMLKFKKWNDHNSIILRRKYLTLAGPHPLMTCNIFLIFSLDHRLDTPNTFWVAAADGHNYLNAYDSLKKTNFNYSSKKMHEACGPHSLMICIIFLKFSFDTRNIFRVTAADGQNCLDIYERFTKTKDHNKITFLT